MTPSPNPYPIKVSDEDWTDHQSGGRCERLSSQDIDNQIIGTKLVLTIGSTDDL